MKSLRRESKNFARVGWILDYALWFQDERGWVGGKRKQLRIELGKDEEARVYLTRNAPDRKELRTNDQKTNYVNLKKNLKGKRSNSKHLCQDSSPERRRD